MPVQREARYLNGADLGKHVSLSWGTQDYRGRLRGVEHFETITSLDISTGDWRGVITVSTTPHKLVTITGKDNRNV